MDNRYVEERDGGYWIAGTRISLDSVVYAFQQGHTPEEIEQSFPLLTLVQIYGAVAYYLDRRETIDVYLAQAREEYEAKRRTSREADPAFYQKLAGARRRQ